MRKQFALELVDQALEMRSSVKFADFAQLTHGHFAATNQPNCFRDVHGQIGPIVQQKPASHGEHAGFPCVHAFDVHVPPQYHTV